MNNNFTKYKFCIPLVNKAHFTKGIHFLFWRVFISFLFLSAGGHSDGCRDSSSMLSRFCLCLHPPCSCMQASHRSGCRRSSCTDTKFDTRAEVGAQIQRYNVCVQITLPTPACMSNYVIMSFQPLHMHQKMSQPGGWVLALV